MTGFYMKCNTGQKQVKASKFKSKIKQKKKILVILHEVNVRHSNAKHYNTFHLLTRTLKKTHIALDSISQHKLFKTFIINNDFTL